MFGIILDFYWLNTNQDPVQVTVTGTYGELKDRSSVDPTHVDDMWPRNQVVPIEEHTVTSQSGGMLKGHLCTLKETNLRAVFDPIGPDA